MDAPTDRSRDMITIMENLTSLQGGNGFITEAQMPPYLETANRAAASASAANPMGYNKFLTKPKRPLSAYNIFFKHEREKLVSDEPDAAETPVTLKSLKVDPSRRTKKRRHRKSHGKIGFADLARTIADKWKTLDAEQRSVYEACAVKEKERYQKEITEWKDSKKSEAAAEEAAMKNQVALNNAELLFNSSRSMMLDSFSNRDLADMRSLETGAGGAWASSTRTDGPSMRIGHQTSFHDQPSSTGGVQDPRDYLKITQQVIDMARASLSRPLFANLGRTGILDDSTARSLLGDQQQSSLRMIDGSQSSSFLRFNNMESGQLSTGALINVPFGNNAMSSLDSESLYQNQFMQSLDSNAQGYLNDASNVRDEFEARGYLNQQSSGMQYRQSEWESSNQEYSDFGGQSTREQLLRSLRNQASRQADEEWLLNSLRNQASRQADEDGLLASLRYQARQADEDGLLSNLRSQASRHADGDELMNRYNWASRQPEGDELINMINASLKDHI